MAITLRRAEEIIAEGKTFTPSVRARLQRRIKGYKKDADRVQALLEIDEQRRMMVLYAEGQVREVA